MTQGTEPNQGRKIQHMLDNFQVNKKVNRSNSRGLHSTQQPQQQLNKVVWQDTSANLNNPIILESVNPQEKAVYKGGKIKLDKLKNAEL